MEWRKLIARGLDPAIQAERAREATIRQQANTFAAVGEAFIAEKLIGPDPDRPIERKGREVERYIRNEFIPKWGPRPVTEITDEDIGALIHARNQKRPKRQWRACAGAQPAWHCQATFRVGG
jgi:hypothetical protein